MKRLRSLLYGFAVLLLLLLLGGSTLGLAPQFESLWYSRVLKQTEVVFDPGGRFSNFRDTLIAKELVPSSAPLSLYVRLTGLDRALKAGRFRIGKGWSPVQILEEVSVGSNAPLKVTLPPGITLHRCAELLEESGWISQATAFIGVASGETVREEIGVRNYEGLFAPDTYFFDTKSDPGKVLHILNRAWIPFIRKIAGTSDLKARLPNGLTLYETIILASILEREVADPVEMATASGVFHNRLRKGWPLGSAATLRYAINDWTGNDQSLPVNLKSPFNTSKKPGLPPTPICIPSARAVQAALKPAVTDFLFFASDNEGKLVFNRSHKDHVKTVRKNRRGPSGGSAQKGD